MLPILLSPLDFSAQGSAQRFELASSLLAIAVTDWQRFCARSLDASRCMIDTIKAAYTFPMVLAGAVISGCATRPMGSYIPPRKARTLLYALAMVGRYSAARISMMVITHKSSVSVSAACRFQLRFIFESIWT